MKRLSVFFCAMVLVLGVVGTANAALWDRGGGLIYDDVLDVTWLQDANYGAGSVYDDGSDSPTDGRMTYHSAIAWAENLTYYDSVRDVAWTDWRLPDAHNQDGSGPDPLHNVTGSELGHMFYNNLSGTAGSFCGASFIDAETGQTLSFQNFQTYVYWFSTDGYTDGPYVDEVWDFNVQNGFQWHHPKNFGDWHAWAVMDGDVSAVPIPSAVWLLGSGLIGLVGFRSDIEKEDT